MDALMLARIQFAANITFHILFPVISIALGWFLLFFKVRYNSTKKEYWMDNYRFWVKVFALCFALGVVSGITMSFQFGTNWPGFMATVGNIAGPLLAYEVLTAFFLEATFLGIMLFGWKHVSNRVHTIATVLVAFGTTLSAFWILVLNSWMHTPTGFKMIDGKAHVTSWLEVVFNPSMPYRVVHMLLASALTVAFLVAGISAYRWLRYDKSKGVIIAMKTGLYLAALLIPIQIIAGDAHGLNTMKYEPAKIAAIEGIWQTQKGIPLELFALPDEKEHVNKHNIEIPKLSSLILTHSWDGEVKGLNEFEGVHPPVAPIFWSFRIMVGMGVMMLLTAWFGSFKLHRDNSPGVLFAWVLVFMSFSGWVATVAGWCTTEIGRQPWLVYGLLKTSDAASNVPSPMIKLTLTMYMTLYTILIISFISVVFYMARKAAKGNKNLSEKGFSSAAIARAVSKKGV